VTKDGLCHVQIKGTFEARDRFTLSEEDPVILPADCHDQSCVIVETDETFTVSTAKASESGEPLMKLEIIKAHFEMKQYITGVKVLSVNSSSLLGIEPHTDFGGQPLDLQYECRFNGTTEPIPFGGRAISLDFAFPDDCWLYGLPERNDEFAIQDTIGQYGSPSIGPDDDGYYANYDVLEPRAGKPYRMFTADHFNDAYYKNSLYGVINQVFARCESFGARTASVMWNNASDTFVDVFKTHGTKSRTVHFMSESGTLEFFLLSSENPHQISAL